MMHGQKNIKPRIELKHSFEKRAFCWLRYTVVIRIVGSILHMAYFKQEKLFISYYLSGTVKLILTCLLFHVFSNI
jgi:hypothetical protein